MTSRRLDFRPAVLPTGRANLLFFPEPVPLRALFNERSGMRLKVRVAFLETPVDHVSHREAMIITRMYEYGLIDRVQRELLVYHWHPQSLGPDYPHLHVSASLSAQVDAQTRRSIDLDKLHVVTGHVSLQAFVRMVITEFKVRPLRAD
jgi:hypothetical protein